MKPLSSEYALENQTRTPADWSAIIGKFSDANIFQTWPYEALRSGPAKLAHLVVKHRERPVAAAQARVVRIPFLGMGMAYLRWGPLWQLRGEEAEHEVFRQAVRALRLEYVSRRRLAIRLVPRLPDIGAEAYRAILKEEGYELRPGGTRYQTVIMDLQPSLEDLTRGLHQKWRNCLNTARKRNLEVVEGAQDELFLAFESMYAEMLDRKQFSSDVNPASFRLIQQQLATEEKLRVVLCKTDGRVCAGAIGSALGETGIYLLGATSNEGMKTNGSYLAQWRLVEWLKQCGCRWYDLHGINPLKNEGTYRFKSRLAGTSGRELQFLGQFEAYPNAASKMVVAFAEGFRARLGQLRERRVAPDRAVPEREETETKATDIRARPV